MSQKKAKKQVLISTTSNSMIKNSKETILVSDKELEQVMYIQYFIFFYGSLTQVDSVPDLVSAFLDLNSEINTIHLVFIKKLGLVV